MLKILILTMAMFFTLHAEVNWQSDYSKALQLSQETKKPIFVFIHKESTQKHVEMIIELFQHPKISERINNEFIPLKIFDFRKSRAGDILRKQGLIVDGLTGVPESLINEFRESAIRIFCLSQDGSIVLKTVPSLELFSKPEVFYDFINEIYKIANPKKRILRYGS